MPAGVVELVATLKAEVPAPATDAGLKLAVAPPGRPLMLKFTVPVKPLSALMVVV